MLLCDLKGSLKSLSQKQDVLYPEPKANEANSLWDDGLVKVEGEVEPKNEFLSKIDDVQQVTCGFEDSVKVWSDFLYARYHPRTINLVNEYQHNDVEKRFDLFPLGRNLWNCSNFQDEFIDKIRNYVEECDYFQVSFK